VCKARTMAAEAISEGTKLRNRYSSRLSSIRNCNSRMLFQLCATSSYINQVREVLVRLDKLEVALAKHHGRGDVEVEFERLEDVELHHEELQEIINEDMKSCVVVPLRNGTCCRK